MWNMWSSLDLKSQQHMFFRNVVLKRFSRILHSAETRCIVTNVTRKLRSKVWVSEKFTDVYSVLIYSTAQLYCCLFVCIFIYLFIHWCAFQKCQMVEFPRVLVLLLKRFDIDYGSMKHFKSDRCVKIPGSLHRNVSKNRLN